MEGQTESVHYRVWLQNELSKRCQKNPRYSVRAFAKLLRLDSSSLSQILSGKRRASPKLVARLCDSLSAEPELRNTLLRSTLPAEAEPPKGNHYNQLRLDTFALISDWYHYAILDLSLTAGFKSTPSWIARRLGITATEATLALERLQRLGLLKMRDGGLMKADVNITNFSAEVTTPALRRFQNQSLNLALEKLETVAVDERDYSVMTMAIDPARMAKAKEMITEFRRKLCRFLEAGEKKEVYHLAVQLYPISYRMSEEGEGK